MIIVKVPFPIPDSISEYERTKYLTMEDYIKAVVVPKILIKLRQGVERLLRKETDSGMISFLEARAAENRKYRSTFINALPDSNIVETIDDIQFFFKEKKAQSFLENEYEPTLLYQNKVVWYNNQSKGPFCMVNPNNNA